MSKEHLAGLRRFYKLDRIMEAVLRYLSYAAAVSVVLTAVVATLNAIVQKVFHGNIASANDYVTYLFVIIIYAALPHVQMETDLTNVDILSGKFSKTAKLILSILGDLLGVVTLGFVSYAMYTNVFVKYLVSQKVATVGATGTFALWPFALLVSVSTFLTAFSFIWNNVRRIVYHGTKFIPLSLCKELGVKPPKRFGPPAPEAQQGGEA